MGGKSCSGWDCHPDINGTAGGGGGGGCIRIDSDVSQFVGNVSAASGCGELSADCVIGAAKGAVVTGASLVSLQHNSSCQSAGGCIDVKLLVAPVRLVYVVATNGSGEGSLEGTSTVVRGFWSVAYKSSSSGKISASATAVEVQSALQRLAGLSKVAVQQYAAPSANGWSWRITLYVDVGSIYVLRVDGANLYSTNADTSIAATSHSSSDAAPFPLSSEAFAAYNASELSSLLQFNLPVLGSDASALWLDSHTLQVLPGTYTYNKPLSSLANQLQLIKLAYVPTTNGRVQSSAAAFLQL